jgi:hypothetical protein
MEPLLGLACLAGGSTDGGSAMVPGGRVMVEDCVVREGVVVGTAGSCLVYGGKIGWSGSMSMLRGSECGRAWDSRLRG